MKRIMIAGERSGCGKTTVTCALLQAMVNRDIKTAAFKCGPDYIDPMFHKNVIGTDSYNLDSYLMEADTLNYLLKRNSADMSVIEGVMGFYDGASFSISGSSHEISLITDTPVILVTDCRGSSVTALAMLRGIIGYTQNKIAGVIFNNISPRVYTEISRLCADAGIEALGFLPRIDEAQIKSRHLGLVTAMEIDDLKCKMKALAGYAEQYIDVDRILEIAECGDTKSKTISREKIADVTVAVARDRAFCFYYEDNLKLLRELGAQITEFSPLAGDIVPECDGIIIGGGYPELYADELEKNTDTIRSVKEKIESGTPCIAECGGFMYLHENMEDNNGKMHKMAGVIKGICRKSDSLVRFGYMEMTAEKDNILCNRGHKIRSREFHYFDSDNCGDGFTARKNGREWKCVNVTHNLFAGFGHIHFYTDISLAENFVKHCGEYRCTKLKN